MRPINDTKLLTERLVLTPLRIEDAEEMAGVLADQHLHDFIGGHPATLDDLRTRYRKLVAGPSRPNETWLNWIVRAQPDGLAIGTLQATVIDHDTTRTAYVAWVIGVPWQNRGFASEAAHALVAWLHSHDVDTILAHIHPDHHASATVAARAGLEPTAELVDGERVWRAAKTR